MSSFEIKTNKVKVHIRDLDNYFSKMQNWKEEMNDILNSLDQTDRFGLSIKSYQLPSKMGNSISDISLIKVQLDKIIQRYLQAESKNTNADNMNTSENKNDTDNNGWWDLSSIIKAIKEWFDKIFHPQTEINNIIYDSEGTYGGDQGHAAGMSKVRQAELAEIARKNDSELDLSTPEKIQKYFNDMNKEGCGYVAIANTIFAYYIGKEKEFENAFGFPMYYNGDLNYDAVIVDIYSKYDNKTQSGTYAKDREKILEDYMKNKGVEVDVQINQNLDTKEIKKHINQGEHVLISYHQGKMYDENNDVHIINGGHSMEVTGVTDDGRLIVSSWGKKYYIDPSEVSIIKNKPTSYSFEVVKYK